MGHLKLLVSLFIVVILSLVAVSVAYSAPYKAELSTSLPGGVGLDPVRDAAERNHCVIDKFSPGELVIKFAHGSGNLAVVRSNGDITIRSTEPVAEIKDIDRLDRDLESVFNYIESCSGAIPTEAKYGCLYYNAEYRLATPGIYKRMVFPPGEYDGQLTVPKCKVTKARVIIIPVAGKNANVKLRGDWVYKYGYGASKVREEIDETTKMVSGTHQFSIDPNPYSAPAVIVDAMTSSTDKGLEFLGGGKPIAIVVEAISDKPSASVACGTSGDPKEGSTPSKQSAEVPEGRIYDIPIDSNKIQELADKIAKQAAETESPGKPKKVAISEFRLVSEKHGTQIDPNAAINVCADLTVAMSNAKYSKYFTVLLRDQLAKLLDELKLHETGIIDRDTAKKLGEGKAADYVLVGAVSDRGATIKVDASMVKAETFEILYSASVEMSKTRKKSVPDSNDSPAAPAEKSPDDIAQNRGDMLVPKVRLVSISKGQTVGIQSNATLSVEDDSLAIEAADDGQLDRVELWVGDSAFPRTIWPLRGQHAALFRLKTPWLPETAIGPKTTIEIKAFDAARNKGEQRLTLHIIPAPRR